MEKDSIEMFGRRGNEFLRSIKKNGLKIAVYMLILGIVMGVIFILVGGDNIWLYFSKTILMLVLIAVLAVVSYINLKIIENGNRPAQILALMGLLLNFVWTILWLLVIWDAFALVSYSECVSNYYHKTVTKMCADGFTAMGKITLATTALSAFGLIGSTVLALKNYDRRGVILPLKVTAMIGLTYDVVFLIVLVMMDWRIDLIDDRFKIMAGFAAVVWIATSAICAIFSQKARERLESKNHENN